ncbi:MAG: acetyl-CoA carboxylase, carboxyltransferase subunit beta [Flavobacteriales bacterium CG03_land_8_20_14_0_80_35_15]|nr:acetyl-CoA carboxylase, carboxyltransferase subunit beta [Zetaproteobacteria bacterium]NDK18070.1 acetyl-CoA carboxylase, carboxyltransferase subunit beta [Flavobacteriales bacterium]OIO11090.1 MAG: acetyl-CoA carboxylase subunit beta [Flavobacteriaceae bacterium CG1_02_35_72]PIR14432.1 MAG: acetyl-CoA carboxylase, carboxyltransferase subunit beta [Flavobacteriales bacterium CG11_big_fil_rev_8_21_14_0_20_35_7]PIV16741.1 MAG: acetyl-CoA carboxylase, carboxyltransferase subunit beta [Flavobact
MSWFKRKDKGIQTPTEEKKDIPKGLWYKTPSGKIIDSDDLKANFWVCEEDGYHVRIGSKEYFQIFFDDNVFTELDPNLTSKDSLKFVDTIKYSERLKEAQAKTNLKDAVRTAVGKSLGKDLVIAAMDFSFIGGSMGGVVGEKIARAINYSIQNKIPFLMISKSGGARMMESGSSLMQLVKTSAKLAQLDEAKIPYISLCTDPTTGGATASFSMLGDINIAEPDALIAFAGPRVVKDTTGKELPKGFQHSEFVLEHGFLDAIFERKQLKKQVNLYIDLIQNLPIRS